MFNIQYMYIVGIYIYNKVGVFFYKIRTFQIKT